MKNGEVYRTSWPGCFKFAIVFLGKDEWGRLTVNPHEDPRLTAPMFIQEKDGKWIYSRAEIETMVEARSWELLPETLEIVEKP